MAVREQPIQLESGRYALRFDGDDGDWNVAVLQGLEYRHLGRLRRNRSGWYATASQHVDGREAGPLGVPVTGGQTTRAAAAVALVRRARAAGLIGATV
jgi:hypothetical protein